MSLRLAEAFVEILARTTGFERNMDKVQVKLKGMEPVFARVRTAAAWMFGGISVGAGIGIKAASDLEETESRFKALFRDQAGAASKWADETASAIKRFHGDLKNSLTTFQAFFVGLGFGAEQSRQMSQKLSQLAVDFASFHNISDDEALQRFISALSGSTEVLDRFGVNLKMAALEQELLRMGIRKTTADASESEKTLARMNIIIRSMGQQGAIGDAARTADSFANSVKGLSASWRALISQLGQVFLPLATDVVNVVAEKARGFSEWAKANEKTASTMLKVTAATTGFIAFGPRIVSVLKGTFSAARWLVTGLGGLVTVFGTLAGVVVHAATRNEGYTETLYKMGRAVGLLRGNVLDLADALEELGKIGERLQEARQAQAAAAHAPGAEDDIAAQEEAIKQLEERLKKQEQARKLYIEHLATGNKTYKAIVDNAVLAGNKGIEFLNKKLDQGLISQEEYQQGLETVRKEVEKMIQLHSKRAGIDLEGPVSKRDIENTRKQIELEKKRLAELQRMKQRVEEAGRDPQGTPLSEEERRKMEAALRDEQQTRINQFETKLKEQLELMKRGGRSQREIEAFERRERERFTLELEKDLFDRNRAIREAERDLMSETERRRAEFEEDLEARTLALREAGWEEVRIRAWRAAMVRKFNEQEAAEQQKANADLARLMANRLGVFMGVMGAGALAKGVGRNVPGPAPEEDDDDDISAGLGPERIDAMEAFRRNLAEMATDFAFHRQMEAIEKEQRRHEEAMKARKQANQYLHDLVDGLKALARQQRPATFG